jgi:hypothetical protein
VALKKPSQAAGKNTVSSLAAEALAQQLADRPYGEPKAETPPSIKAKPISISLPPSIIEQLEDAVRDNKRSGKGSRTVSALVREALEAAGYRN